MQGTTNEVELGDTVVWDNIDEMEDGHNLHQHLECVFNEHTLPILLEKNIIEESENEEEETLDFMDECPIVENFNALEEKVNAIEHTVAETASVVAELADTLSDLTQAVVKLQKPKKNGGK